MVRIFPDRCKCISAVLLVTHCIAIMSAGSLFLFVCFDNTDGVVIDHAPVLPEMYLNYDEFSGFIQISSFGCFLVVLLGLIAATFKKPWSAILFISFTVVCG
jgi:hypothetical protein